MFAGVPAAVGSRCHTPVGETTFAAMFVDRVATAIQNMSKMMGSGCLSANATPVFV